MYARHSKEISLDLTKHHSRCHSMIETTQVYARIQPAELKAAVNFYESRAQYEALSVYFASYETAATLRRRLTRGEPVVIFEARSVDSDEVARARDTWSSCISE
jgi:hypothetical protein